MRKLFFSAVLIFVSYFAAFAQDVEGCKDHPLLTRLPDYYISECTENYDQLDFLNSKGEDKSLKAISHISGTRLTANRAKRSPAIFRLSGIMQMR